jgi:hypothetical protein
MRATCALVQNAADLPLAQEWVNGDQTSWWSTAKRVTALREPTLSLLKIERMWALTVCARQLQKM